MLGLTQIDDRKDLLGHKSREITTHYSAAALENLILAANKVCDMQRQGPTLTVLKINKQALKPRSDFHSSRQSPARLARVAKVVAEKCVK